MTKLLTDSQCLLSYKLLWTEIFLSALILSRFSGSSDFKAVLNCSTRPRSRVIRKEPTPLHLRLSENSNSLAVELTFTSGSAFSL